MTAALNSRSKCDSTLRGTRTVARPPARDAQTRVRPHRHRVGSREDAIAATAVSLTRRGPKQLKISQKTTHRHHSQKRSVRTE